MIELKTIDVEVEEVCETQHLAMHAGLTVGRVGVKVRTPAGRLTFATVRQLFVAPAYRGQGIGEGLLAACLATADLAGCEVINLTVAHNNRGVLPWYISRGFVPAHMFDDGEIILARPLGIVPRAKPLKTFADVTE